MIITYDHNQYKFFIYSDKSDIRKDDDGHFFDIADRRWYGISDVCAHLFLGDDEYEKLKQTGISSPYTEWVNGFQLGWDDILNYIPDEEAEYYLDIDFYNKYEELKSAYIALSASKSSNQNDSLHFIKSFI